MTSVPGRVSTHRIFPAMQGAPASLFACTKFMSHGSSFVLGSARVQEQHKSNVNAVMALILTS